MRELIAASMIVWLVACSAPDKAPGVATHVGDWRDEVIYQIVVDRFDNGDVGNDLLDGVELRPGELGRHQGGDWRGIIRRLDYLERLGVTTIWISPVVSNVQRGDGEDGYHGYWARDFISANQRFGELEDLKELVQKSHRRGIKVIFDIVTNHTGRVFTYDFNDNGGVDDGEVEPPYSESAYDAPLLWLEPAPRLLRRAARGDERDILELEEEHFHLRGSIDFGEPVAKELGDFPTGLRDLATDREDVLEGLIETYAYWVEQTDADGFRVDAVPHVETSFWPRFCMGLRERLAEMGKDRFLLLGEVFHRNPEVLAPYTAAGALDSVFDFPLKFTVIDEVVLGGAPPVQAVRGLEGNRVHFAEHAQPMGVGLTPWQARVAFADNHDTWRLRAELDDPFASRLALLTVFTVDAIPAVYYGTEQDMLGGAHHEARGVFWEHGFDEDSRSYLLVQYLADLRRTLEPLRRGDLRVTYASEYGGLEMEEDAGILAWERSTESERVLVVLNTHARQSSKALIPTGYAPNSRLLDLFEGHPGPFQADEAGEVYVDLPPRSGLVLVPENRSVL